MGIFGDLGGALGITKPATPNYEQALAELYNLPEYYSAGELNAGDYTLGPSAREQISIDPRYKEAQIQALAQLQDVGQSGGLTTADKAALQQVAENASTRERGQREAIAQQAMARGLGGSGMELAQKLIAQQGAAQGAAQEGRDVAQMAQARALEALQGAGELGGRIRSQEYGEQSDLAKARDIISQFNTANRQAIEAGNLANRQNIASQNVGTKQGAAQQRAGILAQSARDRAEASNKRGSLLAGTIGGALNLAGGAMGGMKSPSSLMSPYGSNIMEEQQGVSPYRW